MTRHRGTLNANCKVKEAIQKRLDITWFQLHDILEKWKLETMKRSVVVKGCGGGWETGRPQSIFSTIKYSVWYDNAGYVSWHFFFQTHIMHNTKNELC